MLPINDRSALQISWFSISVYANKKICRFCKQSSFHECKQEYKCSCSSHGSRNHLLRILLLQSDRFQLATSQLESIHTIVPNLPLKAALDKSFYAGCYITALPWSNSHCTNRKVRRGMLSRFQFISSALERAQNRIFLKEELAIKSHPAKK